MATSPIRIAQIGIGHNHGSAKMEALKKLPELFEIVGVTEDDVRWREERGGFSQYKDVPFYDSEAELLAVPGLAAVATEKDGFEAYRSQPIEQDARDFSENIDYV